MGGVSRADRIDVRVTGNQLRLPPPSMPSSTGAPQCISRWSRAPALAAAASCAPAHQSPPPATTGHAGQSIIDDGRCNGMNGKGCQNAASAGHAGLAGRLPSPCVISAACAALGRPSTCISACTCWFQSAVGGRVWFRGRRMGTPSVRHRGRTNGFPAIA